MGSLNGNISPQGRWRAIIVHEAPICCQGLAAVLGATGQFDVVATVARLDEADAVLGRQRVDLLVVASRLADGDGLQYCREVLASDDPPACLVLASPVVSQDIISAWRMGVAGYVDRHASIDEFLRVARIAAGGGTTLHASDVRQVLLPMTRDTSPQHALHHLTPQQRRVFALAGQGMTNRAVAETLGLCEKTVKNYMSHILHKLGMTSRTEVVGLATRLALHQPQGLSRTA